MRLFLSVLLSFTLTFASVPVSAQHASAVGTPQEAVHSAPKQPSHTVVLLECDNDQCDRPQDWGGGLWVFDGLNPGTKGQAFWHYYCIANLTVTAYDGKTLSVERDDPPKSKATHGMPTDKTPGLAGYFTGQYTGTVSGDEVSGHMTWNHSINNPNDRWHATFIDLAKQCSNADGCPLTSGQMTMLGGRLWDEGFQQQAADVLKVASDNLGNAEAEGTLAFIGYRTGSMTPKEIFSRAKSSADKGGWTGKQMLSTCYRNGIGTAVNLKLADSLKEEGDKLEAQADQRDEAIERREIAQADAACASWNCKGTQGQVGGGIGLLGLLFLGAVLSGGDDSGGGSNGGGLTDYGAFQHQRQGEYGGPGPAPPVVHPYVHN